MSVKAVRNYYDQICEQYSEMLENLRDLEAEMSTGLVEPERITRLEEQIKPLKDNYERWSYMMFLLNQPERKSKHKDYERRNKKLLKSLDESNSLKSVVQENQKIIDNIRG